MRTNKLLQQARSSKYDEFYTQLSDIDRELQQYAESFKGKVVYCNCDDPYRSNFVKYFLKNYNDLELKKLIASCYTPLPGEHGYYCEFNGNEDTKLFALNGNGDFRSKECIELLRQSDVIVTNPPFSLFREFVTLMDNHDKQYLIIGNINAITYQEVYSLMQQDKAWLGVNYGRGISGFIVPDYYPHYGSEVKVNSDGQNVIATNNCMWLTNLTPDTRHKGVKLTKEYYGNESSYPQYDNCNAINVNRTRDIPADYDGLIGVPITYLYKHDPQQFEIIRFRKGDDGKDLRIAGKCTYCRILIRRRRQLCKTSIYAIRNKECNRKNIV